MKIEKLNEATIARPIKKPKIAISTVLPRPDNTVLYPPFVINALTNFAHIFIYSQKKFLFYKKLIDLH